MIQAKLSVGAIAKLVKEILQNEKFRKNVGGVIVAFLSPVIFLIVFLCSLASGSAGHNNASVMACFYNGIYSEKVPVEFRTHVTEMKTAFSLLDSAVISANEQSENNSGLDPIWIKAVLYALCFGEDAPSARAANRFVECFYTEEERIRTIETMQKDGTAIEEEETYMVIIPLSQESAYNNLAALLERTITDEDRNNIEHIYTIIAGSTSGRHQQGSNKNTAGRTRLDPLA